ncbi:MAG TPA: SO_0444 family Cu/Zn efflux transporter [Planctomycetota bacterium]|nr:SO_0444 family Cu/Zn efflux transporter [Planctomycetota bacterium]HRV81691.1 SO_0444 family Cu/Zn efflux transporter [Planctomycetota bacterium]
MAFLRDWAAAIQELVLETAPWLLLGLVVAALVHRYLPTHWIAQRLGKNARHPVLLASLLGTPLPLCSCSVLPTAQALRKGGASRGATAAFLVATPETGPDSVGITFGLFDPLFAILRPVWAWASAMVAGWWVDRTREPEALAPTGVAGHDHDHEHDHGEVSQRGPLRQTLGWMLGPLWDDLAPALTLGFVLAGLFSAALPDQLLEEYLPAGILGMLVVGLLGIPLSICATASTPLAAAMVDKGMSPGAALVLLLTGPATNLATLAMVRSMLGARGLGAYLGGIFSTALVGGLVMDWVYASSGRVLRRGVVLGEHTHHSWLVLGSGIVVGLLFLVFWMRRAGRILGSNPG